MSDNFDFKKYLLENKLGAYSNLKPKSAGKRGRLINEAIESSTLQAIENRVNLKKLTAAMDILTEVFDDLESEGFDPEDIGAYIEMEVRDAFGYNREMGKGSINESSEVLTDPNFIAGLTTFLGLGSAIVAGVLRDLKGAKTPEEKKAILAKAAQAVGKATTGEKLNENAGDFNTWLSNISSGRDYIKQDLDDLGIDVSTVTPEEFINAVRSNGELVNKDQEAYKFGDVTTVYPNFISFNKGLETFGTYSPKTGKGSITPKSHDPRANIYPQGSRMD